MSIIVARFFVDGRSVDDYLEATDLISATKEVSQRLAQGSFAVRNNDGTFGETLVYAGMNTITFLSADLNEVAEANAPLVQSVRDWQKKNRLS